jgi:hypothetical protein
MGDVPMSGSGPLVGMSQENTDQGIQRREGGQDCRQGQRPELRPEWGEWDPSETETSQ